MSNTIYTKTGLTSAAWGKLSTADRVAIVEDVFGRNSAKAALYRAKWAAFLAA